MTDDKLELIIRPFIPTLSFAKVGCHPLHPDIPVFPKDCLRQHSKPTIYESNGWYIIEHAIPYIPNSTEIPLMEITEDYTIKPLESWTFNNNPFDFDYRIIDGIKYGFFTNLSPGAGKYLYIDLVRNRHIEFILCVVPLINIPMPYPDWLYHTLTISFFNQTSFEVNTSQLLLGENNIHYTTVDPYFINVTAPTGFKYLEFNESFHKYILELPPVLETQENAFIDINNFIKGSIGESLGNEIKTITTRNLTTQEEKTSQGPFFQITNSGDYFIKVCDKYGNLTSGSTSVLIT